MNKKFLVKGMLVAGFGVAGFLGMGQEAKAAEWVANTPDMIQVEQGAKSYSLKHQDTVWALATKLNLRTDFVLSLNGLNEESAKYLPVGFNVTLVDNGDGTVTASGLVGSAVVTEANKIDPSQPVGVVENNKPAATEGNGTSTETGSGAQTGSGNEGQAPTTPSNPSEGGAEGQTPVEPSNPGDNGNGGETPTEPSNPGEGGNTGGNEGGNTEEPGNGGNTEEPGNGGEEPGNGGNTEEPGNEIPDGPYAGTIIPGVNNGDVGTWTDKNAMMAYIEENWDAVSGGRDDYSMTTNGYGWIAMFY